MNAMEDKKPLVVDESVRIPIDVDSANSKLRPTLLRRLKRALKVTTISLHAGYGIATLLLSVGFGVFVVVDWIAQHFGIAIGEGVFIGAVYLRVTRSYINAQQKLKVARSALDRVDERVFEQVAYALRVLVERGMESVGLVVTVWIMPLALKTPHILSVHLNIGQLGVVGVVIGAVLTVALGAKRQHDKLKQSSSRRIDEIVDHVDEMPEFDWLDNEVDTVADPSKSVDIQDECEVKHE